MDTWKDAEKTVDAIVEVLDTFDWTAAEAQCQALVKALNESEDPFPAPEARRILQGLRRKRQFALMALVGDAMLVAGRKEAEISRQYAQALIEQAQLNTAEMTLRGVLADPDTPKREWAEAMGLVGRIYKQRYVEAQQPGNARQQANLRQAIAYYHDVYRTDRTKYFWHGINVIALLARAERDAVDVSALGCGDFRALAQEMHGRLRDAEEDAGTLRYWDRATKIEAQVALGDFDGARKDLREYMTDREADAFEYASTLRQLREVWQIDRSGPPGAILVAGLNGAMLKRHGGEVELGSHDVQDGLQANFSGVADLPLKWWQTGLDRCAAVARVEDRSGRRVGSGFLVQREEFLGEPGAPLLMTNWHVVSERREHPKSIAPDQAQATFEGCARTYKIASEIVAYSRAHDVSFLALDDFDGLPGVCPLVPSPAPFDADTDPRVYVIGYPGGRGLSFSLHDSAWLDTDGTKLHYRTPTEPGSSGSPVFDQQNWTLLAIHHAGKAKMQRLNGKPGTYEANEGIAASAIVAQMQTTRKS